MPQAIPLIVAVGTTAAVATTAIGATVIFGTLTVAMVVGTVASVAVGSVMARRQQKKAEAAARAQALANLKDVQNVVRSAVEPQSIVYGKTLVGGNIPFWFTTGDVGQFHHWAQVIASHRVDGVEAYYVGDEQVTVDAGGWVTTAKYCRGGTTPLIRIRLLDGSQAALDSELVTASDGALTSNDAGRGLAYLYVRWEADYDVFGQVGPPTIRCVVRGKPLFDPRTGLTTWSDNAALAVRDYLTSYQGLRCTASEINDADVIASANVCDELVPLTGGGSQKRYTVNGALSCGANLKDNLETLTDAMAGMTVWTQGQWSVQAGAWQVPVAELGVDDIVAVEDLIAYTPRRELFNTVTGTYIEPSELFAEKQFPIVTNPTYVNDDSGYVVERDLPMPMCNDPVRAQRMAKIELERARQAVTASVLCKWTAYDLRPGSHISITIARYGWDQKTFFVADRTLSADGVRYVLRETAPEVWDWAFGEATVVDPSPNTNLPNPFFVPPITGLAADSGTGVLQLAGDGTVISRIRLHWAPVPSNEVLTAGRIEINYRPQGSPDWVTDRTDGDATATYVGPVEDGLVYELRARAINSLGQRGPWAEITHVVVGKSEPPPEFDLFLVLVQPDGTRQFNFGYTTTPRPLDWEGAEIRYLRGSHVSPAWADMVPINDERTYFTASPVETNQLLAGVHTFACRSRDTSGNLSTARVLQIDLPDRRLGNAAGEWNERALGWPGTLVGGVVLPEDNYVEGFDPASTWDGLPSTWDAWSRWVETPQSPLVYTTPVRDIGAFVRGLLGVESSTLGTETLELRTSADGVSFSDWGDASLPFGARFIQLRVTLAAGAVVPTISELSYTVFAEIVTESLNDLDITTLGAKYLGTGDCRVPLLNTFSVIFRVQAVIQDGTNGTWSWVLIDKDPTGPRAQFRFNGSLANPQFVDFYVEGY